MQKSFEIIEHTADIGIRAFGDTLPEVYANAARGLLSLMVAPESVRPSVEETVDVNGTDAVDLMVSWLHEIVYRFDTHHRAFATVHIEDFNEWRLRAVLAGEALDLERHAVGHEVKAVTWHRARVEKTGAGWVAEVYLDL